MSTPVPQELIVELATQTHRPVEEVKQVYEQQFNRLETYATVKTYLAILARRRARETLSRH
jgi:Protein of unknown function (DUF3562)